MNEASRAWALEDAGRLLSRRVGLRLDPAIRGRLARAVRDEVVRCDMDDAAYVTRLDRDPELLQHLLNRVTVQETSFFRDPGQFVALASQILPALQAQGGPIRVWSAGCANGQEAYSLAMTFAEHNVSDWRITATDISTRALERTRSARYVERELRGLSAARRERFLEPVDNAWQVREALRERVDVTRHNLAADPPPFERGQCQVVFCRNVLIYFQHDDVVAFLDRLADRLSADGHLFLGYSESLWQVSDRFQLIRLGDAFAYQCASATTATFAPPDVTPPVAPARRPVPSPPAPRRQPVRRATSMELMAEGEAALGRGDHAAAIAVFRKAVYTDPDHPVAHLNLGLALEVSGHATDARRAYAAARAALDRCDTAAVETTLEGYHLDELVSLLDREDCARMTTVVRFRAPAGQYALPVDHVLEVRSAAGLTPLPEPRSGIAGIMRQDDDAFTVLSVLGEPGEHVIVIEEGGLTFGLLVTEVTRVHPVDEDAIGPPPPGQDGSMVSGVLVGEDGLVLLLDSIALRGRLSS